MSNQSFDFRLFLLLKERISQPVNYDKPYQKFIEYAASNGIGSYGNKIPKKIMYDLNGVLKPLKPRMNMGDAVTTTSNIAIEFKTSIESSSKGKESYFNLSRLRPFHNFQFFVVNLISVEKNGLKSHFYCISKDELFNNPEFKLNFMNGNKETNEGNVFIERRLTLKKSDAYKLLGKHNLLSGTSYNDLKRFMFRINGMTNNGTYYKSKKRSTKKTIEA